MKSSAKTAPETTGEHQLAFNDHAAGDYAGSTPEPEPLEIPPPPPAEPSNQVEKMPTVPEDFAKCEKLRTVLRHKSCRSRLRTLSAQFAVFAGRFAYIGVVRR
jgi:hypothetical protein